MLLCPHPRILLCVLQGEVARRQNTGATLSINLCRLFSGTHHLPSRRTRVSSKNCWLPSSSSTCPSETLMLRLHSSPLEGKLQLRVGQPPQNTIEIKHFSQKLESAISPFTFPPFTLFTLPTARGLREAEKPRSRAAGGRDRCVGRRRTEVGLTGGTVPFVRLEVNGTSVLMSSVVREPRRETSEPRRVTGS